MIESDWKAVGSTALPDARDETFTNPSVNGTCVPTYNLSGVRDADDYDDLWDDSIRAGMLTPVRRIELIPPSPSVWTETNVDGLASADHLGNAPNALLGRITVINAN